MTASLQTPPTPRQDPIDMTMPEGATPPSLPLFQNSTCLDDCLRNITSLSLIFRRQYCADQCIQSKYTVLTTAVDGISCLSNCPSITQGTPVCGTDGVTYPSLDALECSQSCGVGK
ncbi:hypothetical protein RR48_00900 [Papilio machaon]|uniref:Kazal-like domain-containing protein n=1 Tax=Papilio machaon TaxID=76193 RepID=A0A0N1IF85_PAPMA|nr:hypothetical protein RR48_00900 [Papilio machaon]